MGGQKRGLQEKSLRPGGPGARGSGSQLHGPVFGFGSSSASPTQQLLGSGQRIGPGTGPTPQVPPERELSWGDSTTAGACGTTKHMGLS